MATTQRDTIKDSLENTPLSDTCVKYLSDMKEVYGFGGNPRFVRFHQHKDLIVGRLLVSLIVQAAPYIGTPFGEKLNSDLYSLLQSIRVGFDSRPYIPLLDAALSNKDSKRIWEEAYKVIEHFAHESDAT